MITYTWENPIGDRKASKTVKTLDFSWFLHLFDFWGGAILVVARIEKMLVLGAQKELEARSLHISHRSELSHHVESPGASPGGAGSAQIKTDGFFVLYAIFLAYRDSISWIRCVVA